MLGCNYTLNPLKSGRMASTVIEIFEFYCSDMDRHYDNLHDYINDKLIEAMDLRDLRYFEEDIFEGILVCDLCL